LRAATLRLALLRFFAALLACFDNALREADECPLRFNTAEVARDRLDDVSLLFLRGLLLCFFAACDPLGAGGNLTPALRALERPIAMACFGEAAPCLPSRT
jgi:hypothetical protein